MMFQAALLRKLAEEARQAGAEEDDDDDDDEGGQNLPNPPGQCTICTCTCCLDATKTIK